MPDIPSSTRALANASTSRRIKYRADIFALAAYLLLALLLTYPLVTQLFTHVAGDGSDDPALTWNLWWVPYAIINLGQSPIYTQHIFYPIGLDLAFYTLTYLNALLAIPIQYALNLVAAANVNLLFSFVASGYGTFLLVKYLLRTRSRVSPENFVPQPLNFQHLCAFAAGALYAFSSNKFLYASLGQFNIASSHWIPFFVLVLVKLTDAGAQRSVGRSRRRLGFLLGLFLLFQALSEFIYASFLLIFAAIYLVYWVISQRRQLRELRGLLLPFGVGAATFFVPMFPILSALIRDTLSEGDFIQQGLGFADVFSTDALGFFVPSHLNPFFGNYESQFHFAYINFGYLGYIAVLLALVSIIAVPRARIWAVLGAIFLLITLGPSLRIDGAEITAPYLPFNLLLEIPFIKGNRYPSRWSVMLTLALAIMVGYGMLWVLQYVRGRRKAGRRRFLPFFVIILLAAAMLFEHLSIPLPQSDLQVPEVYSIIARDPGNFAVLELPLAWRNGFRMTGTLDQAMMFAQFYQTAHAHPILGGNTSRNPERKFQYFTESPIINSLVAVETGHELDPAAITRDQTLAPDVLRFFGIKYIVWHSPRNPQNRFALDAARAYVETQLPVTRFYDASDDRGDIAAYRVNDLAPLNQTIIHPNDPLARLNFAEGWGALGGTQVWATRRESRLFWRLDQPRDSSVALRLFAPMPNQHLTVVVNGRAAAPVALGAGWGEYSLSVAGDLLRAGMNQILLQFDSLVPVSTLGEPSIVAYSAGSEVGDFAHIFVNGADQSLNQRGYNIVVIDPLTRVVESRTAFDTFASEQESTRLAQFIAQIPQRRIVAVAVRDEASQNLTQAAANALRSIGAKEDLLGKFRWSHAVIGVKGAASALEQANEVAPAQVVQGVGAMEPQVAAAVEWIAVK